jgi:hypothetical protein
MKESILFNCAVDYFFGFAGGLRAAPALSLGAPAFPPRFAPAPLAFALGFAVVFERSPSTASAPSASASCSPPFFALFAAAAAAAAPFFLRLLPRRSHRHATLHTQPTRRAQSCSMRMLFSKWSRRGGLDSLLSNHRSSSRSTQLDASSGRHPG